MAMHWYKETHGECVSQTYRMYDLDEIGDDLAAAKRAAFKLLNVGDTLIYGDLSGARYAYGEYMTLQNVKYAVTKKAARLDRMPEGSLPWYAKPEKGYHFVYYWEPEDGMNMVDRLWPEFMPREEMLDGKGSQMWNKGEKEKHEPKR